MSELFDTTFRCGDAGALVSYVYGESSSPEREAIAAHLAHCASCADEVAGLCSTREVLTAWQPPAQALGFRVTRADAPAETESRTATVLRPPAWWSRPLPAWAQVAAAVLIFASGLTVGMARTAPALTGAPAGPAASATTIPVNTTTVPGVTREELAQVEQRLRGELAQARPTAVAAPDSSDRGVLQRVSQMIAESEARQQKELEFRTSVLATDFANTRRMDLANIEKRLGSTSIRVLSNQQDINSLAQRVGYSPSYSPYVP